MKMPAQTNTLAYYTTILITAVFFYSTDVYKELSIGHTMERLGCYTTILIAAVKKFYTTGH
jgi:hypothetical protein